MKNSDDFLLTVFAVVLREVATSPIPWAAQGQEKPAAATGGVRGRGMKIGGRQLSVLKQRVAHLSQQVSWFGLAVRC